YIQGYTIFNDFSLPEQSYFRPAITSKCYDSFGPLGPAIIDKEAIEDPHNLDIKTFVNGELRQEGHSDELVWSIPALVEFISSFKTLYPGEVIATGFPAGRVDVFVGDEVSIEIENVGRLTNKLVSEKEYYS
ncbi:MAG: 5-oxopent-3-ene-1,2,5-tricarboxylate decarboxylase, partial [Gammaproteobacteria bacterium]